jgi:hypothetical protein
MRRNRKAVVGVSLAMALLLFSLDGICMAQVSSDIESWMLERKWGQVQQALTADDVTASPVARLWSAYASLAMGDYRGATAQFSRLGNAADVTKLVEYSSWLVLRHPKNAVAQMLKGDVLARSGD